MKIDSDLRRNFVGDGPKFTGKICCDEEINLPNRVRTFGFIVKEELRIGMQSLPTGITCMGKMSLEQFLLAWIRKSSRIRKNSNLTKSKKKTTDSPNSSFIQDLVETGL